MLPKNRPRSISLEQKYHPAQRDIDLLSKIMFELLKKSKKLKSNDIINVCSNRPISLKNIIDIMKVNNIKPKINKISLQQADIIKTHGNNKKLINLIGKLKFNSVDQSILKTILWYKKYNNIK